MVRLEAEWIDPIDFDLSGYESEYPMWTGDVREIARDSAELRDLASGDFEGLGTSLVTCGASGNVLVIHPALDGQGRR
ncbi:hypothetical protein [Planctomycetes bacterium Poly30]|uniref:hypothetical protein n=1 Tax=Saltatorellus ferox TaxID=2528018 RepID=UPI0011A1A127